MGKLDTSLQKKFSFSVFLGVLFLSILSFSIEGLGDTLNWGNIVTLSPENENCDNPSVGTANNSTALAIWRNNTQNYIQSAFFDGASWSSAVTVSSTLQNRISDLKTSFNSSGQALAIWPDSASGVMQAAYFNGTSWGAVANIGTVNQLSSLQVSLASNGNGVATWSDSSGNIYASIFNGSNWGSATIISEGVSNQSVDVSTDAIGRAVCVWVSTTNGTTASIYANTYDGQTWAQPTSLVTVEITEGGGIYSPCVASSSNWNSIALWELSDGTLQTDFFDGTWSSPVTITSGIIEPSTYQMSIYGDTKGIAVFEFTTGQLSYNLSALYYDGSSWSTSADLISSTGGLGTNGSNLSINTNGDAAVIWTQAGSNNSIYTSLYNSGGTWSTPTMLSPSGEDAVDPCISINYNSTSSFGLHSRAQPNITAQAVWTNQTGNISKIQAIQGTAEFLLPPSNFSGKCNLNRSAFQSERFVTLTWSPSNNSTIVFYRIYRETAIIGEVSIFSPCMFEDHNRATGITSYSITSVDSSGNESAPSIISVVCSE